MFSRCHDISRAAAIIADISILPRAYAHAILRRCLIAA